MIDYSDKDTNWIGLPTDRRVFILWRLTVVIFFNLGTYLLKLVYREILQGDIVYVL